MYNFQKKIKRGFVAFVTISICAFVFVFFFLKSDVLRKNNDALLINQAGRQRMLSQRISKLVFALDSQTKLVSAAVIRDSLHSFTKEIKQSHRFLYENYKNSLRTPKLDTLFYNVDSELKVFIKSCDSLALLDNFTLDKETKSKLKESELSFLFGMDTIADEYQKIAEIRFNRIEKSFYLGFLILGIILIITFIFLWLFNIRELIRKNDSLDLTNKKLATSERKIKEQLKVVEQLKLELESKADYNRIFIEQAAPSLSMVDKDMNYIAVSEKWRQEYDMIDKEVIGRSHYDIFTNLTDDRKAQHQRCLQGEIDKCDEGHYVREDGTEKWYFWDIRPWYSADGSVGGLLMYTGDITKIKNESLAKGRVEQILKSTNKVARVGTWELDIETDEITFSNMSRDILKLPKDYKVYGSKSLHIYKDGVNRSKIVNAVSKLKSTGESFDLVLEVVNLEGEQIWVRDIGQAEFLKGKCKRVFGILQDITHIKNTENALFRKNQLLNFAEEISLMGHWQWNVKEERVDWSDSLYLIMDLDKNLVEITPKTFLGLTHPDDLDSVKSYMDDIFNNSVFEKVLVVRIISGLGIEKTVQVLSKNFTNEHGDIVEIIGTCQDISKQRLAEAKFKGLLESAPDAMVIVNENKKIHLVNKQAEKIFGYTSKELLNKSIEVLLPNRLVNDFKMYRDNYFSKPQNINLGDQSELIGVHKNGEEFTVQVNLSPMQTEEGMLVSAAIRDITAQKVAKQKLVNANNNLKLLAEKLINKNTQLADFAQITSHNLRAPVSNLKSLVDIFEMTKDSSEKEEVFDKFKTVTDHLSFTLNTLLEALRIKKEKVNKTKVYFDEALNRTKEILAGQIIESGTKIVSDFSVVNHTYYNKIYFDSLFLNLIENAIKYRSQKSVPVVLVYTEIINSCVVLKIKDNGLGIDVKKHKHKLFGMNKVFHRHPEAKGVGLFMTKLHVESMGGEITVESEVNVGSTFIVKFSKEHKMNLIKEF
jgi:PAS domain S-box-containing protein